MIVKETSNFRSNGVDIYYDTYRDDRYDTPKAIIQIAHGMVEHRKYYEYIAHILAKNGFVVAINDHRGHGDSINDTLHLGEMGENGFENALLDMRILHDKLKERFPSQAFILIGHSMGSLLARRFLQDYESKLHGLILCGTPSPYVGLGIGIAFLKICRYVGLRNIGQNLAHKLSFLGFNRKYSTIDRLDSGKMSGMMWINRDEAQIRTYLSDNKRRFIFTINSFIHLFMGLKAVFSPYPNPISKPNLPILFISGEDDACGKFGKGVLEAFKHLILQGYCNVKCILYSQARHELFLEINKDEVIADLIAFIEHNLPKIPLHSNS